ncbi:MAG: polymerase delta subunit [Bacteroidetes bacterium]|jgi:DNA polymerase-3 subunit delta|nr:polymerase delta subunit [Bacteroidota bacterium]
MKAAEQILLDLKRKIYKPIYFLSGEETYYIDQISDYIEENVLDEADREFNQNVVYGKDTDLVSILGLAKQFPMMSEHQVVIVKEAQNLKELNKSAGGDDEGSSSKSSSSSASQQLLAYINNPQPTSILVFCYKYKTIDKRSAIAKSLQKNAVYFEAPKLYDNQVPEWINNHVKEIKYTIGPKASFLMAEFLGNDLSKISNEIQKLVINLKPGEEITTDLIQNNIGISKEYNVFELQDALSKKDILKANRIIMYFASNEKEHPLVMTVSSLFGYFSKILRFHFLPDKSKFAAAQALGVNPYFVDGYARAAAMYPTAKLKQIFAHLKECDLKSKGVDNSGIDNGELLKELVFKILH